MRFLTSTSLVAILVAFTWAVEPETGLLTVPESIPISVAINQIGYDPDSTKICVVQVRDACKNDPAEAFQLIDMTEKVVFFGELTAMGRIHEGTTSDWGARFWNGEFTDFRNEGEYRVRIAVAGRTYESFPFKIQRNLLYETTLSSAARFFWFQRCGYKIPGLHNACHMDDAVIPSTLGEGRKDASGGWHNAGDFNKYATISCYSAYALLTTARNVAERDAPGELFRELTEEGFWGADWLMKMWQSDKGIIYQEVWSGYDNWGCADDDTDGVLGTADDRPFRGEGPSGMTAAALAAAARATKDSPAKAKAYREAAEDLWRGAVRATCDYEEDVWGPTCADGFCPQPQDAEGRIARRTAALLLADLELEALTGETKYTENAQDCVRVLLKLQQANGLWFGDSYTRNTLEGTIPASLALYVLAHPDIPAAIEVRKTLRAWMDGVFISVQNPFGLLRWDAEHFFNPAGKNYCYVGQNSQYLSNVWALNLASRVIDDSRTGRTADRLLDWVLGCNPYNLCMFEGFGSFNPPFYLHRFAPDEARGAVPGAVCNGFCLLPSGEDIPWFDLLLPPRRVSFRTSEPWEPHNAFYLLALSSRCQDP